MVITVRSYPAPAVLALLAAGALWPQTAGGQETLSFGLSQSLQGWTNRALDQDDQESSGQATTGLDVDYLTSTRNQTLGLGAAGALRVQSGPNTSDEDERLSFEAPEFTATYTRTGPGSQLSLNGFLRSTQISQLRDDVSQLVLIDDETLEETTGFVDEDGNLIDPDDLEGTGSRRDLSLNAALAIRQDTPLALTFTAGARRVRYVDTTQGLDLFDFSTARVGVSAGARLSDIHTLNLGLGVRQTDSDDPEVGDDRTIDLDVGVSAARPAGSRNLGVDLTFREDRTFLGVSGGTSFARPGYQVSANLGATATDDGEGGLTGSLSAARDLPLGEVQVSAERGFTAGREDGDANVRTAVSGGYQRPLTPLTNASFNASYVRSADLDEDETVSQVTFGVTLSRQLTEDWSLSGGLQAVNRQDEDSDAQSTRIFLNVGRNFEYRF